MRSRAIIITILLCFWLLIPWAEAAVTPSSITIPGNMPYTVVLTWRLNMTAPPASSTSTTGIFRPTNPDPPAFYTNSTALTAYFIGDNATVTETLTIPSAAIKKAQELGLRQFLYRRVFTGVSTEEMTINLTSPSAAALNINNIRLYFENKRPEITVKRKEPGLKTFADINFTGKGLLKGYWQVDDRIISYVNKNLVYGTSLTIATPDLPALPTFSEGTHVVKFIIQSPDQGIQSNEFPKALYYVTPSETTETVMVNLLNPFNLAMLERKSPVFQWQTFKPLALYLVEFMETENSEPIFAAYTIETRYVVPNAALRNYLQSPQPYYWRVTGFDKENNIAGESEVRQVRFKTE
ncbi:MAG: hypothetical protein EHM45_05960 [Desulfobacteraceae bacterium]|nr:MAG: hypothetical protein EHM45_05960 [Desulfobacteraceae bacterium]